MYGLYDKEGILRFVDSDKDVCIAYAELFELGSFYDKNCKKIRNRGGFGGG